MTLNRRDFIKAAAVTGGATAVAVGAVRSFIPEARAGQPLGKTFDTVPVVDGNFASTRRSRSGAAGESSRATTGNAVASAAPTSRCTTTCSCPPSATTAKRCAGSRRGSTKRRSWCASSWATRSTRAASAATAPRATRCRARCTTPIAFRSRSSARPGSKRGDGKWVRTTWDEALSTIGKKMRETLTARRRGVEEVHHAPRRAGPTSPGFTPRVWASRSARTARTRHTNICSAGARIRSPARGSTTTAARPTGRTRGSSSCRASHAADAGHYFQQSAGRSRRPARRARSWW
jgi:anaerobic selenocysteine-containing dehydrogenase